MVFNRRNLDWWCERGILALVLATLMFAPLAFGAVFVWSFLVVQLLVAGIALVWLVRLWGGHKPKLLWPPLAWAVAVFVLYAVARYFTADIEHVARLELIRVSIYAFLFFAVICNLYGQDAAEAIAFGLTIVAALASSYALVQFFHHSNRVWNMTSPYPGRASGTYINPDHFAGFLELVLPLPLAFLMAGRVGVITRLLLGYATLAIMAGLVVTLSRGAWIAAAAGVLMLLGFLLCHKNHALRAFLVLLVLVAAGSLFIFHLKSTNVAFMRRALPRSEGAPPVVDYYSRLQIWSGAVQMWRDHPWWGAGPGHFDYRFREYRPQNFQRDPDHAHNDYLELLADWGAVGAAIVFAGMGIFLAGMVRSWPHVRREENDFGTGMSSRYAFFLGAVSGLFALGLHSLVDFNLHIPANDLVGVVLLALAASNLRFATKRYWVRTRLPWQCALTLLFGGFVVFLGIQAWRRGGEELWTRRAEVLETYSTDQAAALQKALACEPKDFRTAYNIGECYRIQSLNGGDNDTDLAKKALEYYQMGRRLNPASELCPLRAGACLDWLGHHRDAEPCFADAEARDPNGNFVVANIGWHYLQTGDFAAARQWFMRADKLSGWKNDTAQTSLREICGPKLVQKALGQLPMSFFYPGKEN